MDKLNQRLDQWLWHVRIYKTRQIASKAIVSGNIKVKPIPLNPITLRDRFRKYLGLVSFLK